MSTTQTTKLLANLGQLGIRVWVDGENLRFKAPQGALTPELKAALSAQKAALMELLRAHSSNGASAAPSIQPRKATENPPLSFSQERLWLMEQLGHGNAAYNIFDAIEIQGRLNFSALEQAVNEIARRHEVLRTVFLSREGQPFQEVLSQALLPICTFNLERLSEQQQRLEFQRLAKTEINRPFDLTKWPLLRLFLFRFTSGSHVLLLNLHHIISDGWSTSILISELKEIYQSYSCGVSSSLPPLSLQYADFASWQREWMKGDRLDQELSFWKQQLIGAPETLHFPSDRPRPRDKSSAGSVHAFHLSPELTRMAVDLCREKGVTLYMLLLSVWNLLIQRYSGQHDFVIGTPVANRIRPELEPLIGFFVNTLALRFMFSDDWPFLQLLSHVRVVTLAAQDHQELPFEKLIEELQPKRDTSYTPIFQVMFVLQNVPAPEIKMPGLTLHRLPLHGDTSKFDLLFSLQEFAKEELNAELEYDTELFNASTIERMAAHFCALFNSALRNPQAQISELSMLSEAESTQLLLEWNDTSCAYPQRDGFIHQQIEKQAELNPQSVAVIFEGRQLTYGELNRRANQLAWKLRSLGVKPEVSVAICIERSLEMVVGLLGILKAGAAYVPLDPGYPKDRLAYMMSDAEAPVLLTQASLRRVLPVHQAHVLCLDSEWLAQMSSQSEHNPETRLGDTDLAYVIYTSGSTGQPKGAMNTHVGIRNRLLWMQERYHLTPHDAVLQKTPFSFDVSVWELFWPLMVGAQLIIARPGGHQERDYLVDLIRSRGITTVHFVPSMLQIFLEQDGVEQCSSLKRVICSGEALSLELKNRFFARLGCQLHNLYGPTEAAVDVTWWQCHQHDGLHTVPIGRPIANTQMYVLNRHMKPVPVGVAGELYIGGLGLARGYWKRPALTAEKFLPDPFSQTGARLYRTGDVGRYREDGAIDYLGRADHQVKIRGFRIELGEIEAALLRQAGIRESVVVVREEKSGDKRLVAYVAPTVDAPAQWTLDLKNKLKQELPDYMVPSAIIGLESLPLSPNGKIDRKALPAPDFAAHDTTTVVPRTPTEEGLAGIWAEVLGIQGLGIHSNFFDLGGHSLLAIQVMARINDAFKVNLTMRALFETPTIAELAKSVEAALLAAPVQSERMEVVSHHQHLPLSFSQENLWLFEQLSPGTATYTTCRAGHIHGPLNPCALEDTVNELIRRHEALRTSFENADGQPSQIVHPIRRYSLPVGDLSALAPEDRQREAVRVANEYAQRHIDLGSSPVARFVLLRLDGQEHVFVLGIHHVAYDLWSGGILLRETELIYLAFAAGLPCTEPLPAIQYADFAVWQRKWLHGEALDKQFAYWKERLSGLSAIPMEIPTDRPRPAVERFPGASVYPEFSKDLTAKLQELARRERVTQFMLLLAVFKVLLHRYTRQHDVVVGSVIANRNRPEMENTVGFFDNVMVLRSDASGNPTFRDYLQHVRDVALGAYAHQHLPFDYLVKELQPERIANRTPWIQAMFVFLLNYPAMEREIAGLKVVPYKLQSGKAMFDLLFALRDSEQGLKGELAYNCELFDESTITRMVSHFHRLLRGIVEDPQKRISELSLLDAAEEQRLLLEWNDTAFVYSPRGGWIHQQIEQQSALRPDATAVVFEGQELTYTELNQKSNQLARKLHLLGAGRGALVAICMERSLEMVISLVATLKAGAAYVPLDPGYPRERLAYMLEDAQAPVLLAQERILGRLPKVSASVLMVDSDWDQEIASCASSNLDVPLLGEDLAYVIYTSGSTGMPKAAMNTHAGIRNRLLWGQETYGLTPQDKVLQKTPFSFDVSVWEFFWPLIIGAPLVVAKPGGHQDSSYLVDLIQRQGITTVHFVPSMLQMFLEEPGLEECAAVKRVMCSGEALPLDLKLRFFGRLRCELHNLYGPTEASVEVTFWECRKDDGLTAIPIGQPIANIRIYVLDSEMRPVPIGVPGDLYIGGIGVARGYWRRPALTAENFVPDPFSLAGGDRLYRSGDVARYRNDGRIEYLGRADHQVKIRGFRIELGEIEAALLRVEAVKEAVVMAREDKPGDKRLAAYLVLAKEEVTSGEQTIEQLKTRLKEELPPYMAPSAFVLLEKMPLLPNGKVNRASLPAPELDLLPQGPYLGPRDTLEMQLVEIWEDILSIRPIGVRDNFFDLGGHSLRAVQLTTSIRRMFGQSIPIAFFVQNATIEALARALRREVVTATRRQALVRITSGGDRKPFFCVHPVGGNVLCYINLAQHLGPDQPFYALQSPDQADLVTIEAIASLYLASIESVQAQGPYLLGGWSMGGVVAFEMARQLQLAGHSAEVFLIDSVAPDLALTQHAPDDWALLRYFVRDLEGISGAKLEVPIEPLQGLEISKAAVSILEQFRKQGTLPGDIGQEEMLGLFQTFRNNLKALLNYKPVPYAGPLTLISSSTSRQEQNDASLGWSKLALAQIEIHEVEGNHYSVVTGPEVKLLAALLKRNLEEHNRVVAVGG